MYYKDFHGLKISALGMGGVRFATVPGDLNRIDREKAIPLVRKAYQQGINFFDTAYTYQNGDSERFFAEALAPYPRESYYLSSKFYADGKYDIRQVFEEQLQRLQTDYIDFYMLHSLDDTRFSYYTDKEKDYIGYLLEQKKAGRIRFLGFSTHASPQMLEQFLDHFDGYDMALMQLNFVDWSLLDAKRQYEILTDRKIPVWVMEPLKGGRLAKMNEDAKAVLKAFQPERSAPSWSFRFLMGLPNVQTVLSCMAEDWILEENLKTFEAPDPLSSEELQVLMQAKEIYMKDMGVPCSACRYCCATCPAELNIPELIRIYNEKNISGSAWRIAGQDRIKGAEHCLQCGICLSYCPQRIDIPAVMKKLQEKQ